MTRKENKMKYITPGLAIAVLLLVGCIYESPLTKEHSIAIDSALLGSWDTMTGEDKEGWFQDELMMILKYSDTEYLIHYPAGEEGIYYRGYPVKVGGISCVQLQVVGTHDGPPKKGARDLFCVVSYQLTDNGLEIRQLNYDLVDDDLKTTDELRKAFLKHKDSKELFIDPGIFRKKIAEPDQIRIEGQAGCITVSIALREHWYKYGNYDGIETPFDTEGLRTGDLDGTYFKDESYSLKSIESADNHIVTAAGVGKAKGTRVIFSMADGKPEWKIKKNSVIPLD